MSAYVTLPKQDWVNALDAVRAKTGSSELIASAELAGKIEAISGGSGGQVEIIINQIFFKDMTRESVSLKQDALSLFIPDIQKTKYVIVIGGRVLGILGPDNGYAMEVSGFPVGDDNPSTTITTGLSSSTSGQTKLTINGQFTNIDLLTHPSESSTNYLLEAI